MSIGICHRCEHRANRETGCSGACPCLIDSRDIIAHAQANYCPLKKYGDGIEPDNWAGVPKVEVGKLLPPQPPPQFPVAALSDDERVKLGDLIHSGIQFLGLDVLARLWENATGKSCGCAKRREWLNRVHLWKK